MKSSHLVYVVILFGLFVRVDSGEAFRSPNAFGKMNYDGGLSKWVDLPGSVSLGPLEIPLRLNYSSSSLRAVDGPLGYGWWVPLLESTVFEVDSDELLVRLPTGRSVSLKKSQENMDDYISRERDFTGRITNGRGFMLEAPCGVVYQFERGHLVRADSGVNEWLRWVNLKDGSVSIENQDGASILNFSRVSEGAERAILTTSKSTFTCDYDSYPIFQNDGGLRFISSSVRSLSSIIADDGRGVEIEREFVPVDGIERMFCSVYGEESNYVIGLDGGRLMADDLGEYTISNLEVKGGRVVRRKMSLLDENGGVIHSREFDSSKFRVIETDRNGGTVVLWKLATEGAAHGKLRRKELFSSTGELISYESRSYNEEGDVLRKVAEEFGSNPRNVEEIWSDGLLISRREKVGGVSTESRVDSEEGTFSVSRGGAVRVYRLSETGSIILPN